ncbi:hypothetical protein [Anaerosinus massiliensis]|uniref:hypothetical protein n=1 Tax=Massilibacillus massiliensis TaxID=1806837 RepID=UPI000DA60652|nr:hypothetical protein [Massilibacillus massiliensis]
MADDNGLDFSDLEEFKQQNEAVAREYPGTAEKHLKRIGNKFKKIVSEKSPDSGTEHKRKLKKSWKSEMEGHSGDDLKMNIWSTSPHFHLVDRGHKKVDKKGNAIGFVQGKHFLEATAKEVESDVVPAEIERLYKTISKKIGD